MFNSKEIIAALDEIKQEIKDQSISMENQKIELDNLKNHIDKKFEYFKISLTRLETRDSAYFKEIEHQLNLMKNLNSKYEGSLENLKLIRAELTDKICEKIDQDLTMQITGLIDRMDVDVKKYNELKQNISGINNSLDSLKSEINKFNNISSKIKESDFELIKHKKNLDSMDRHKLELMNQIDHLQRMVGRMRNNSRFNNQ